MPPKLTIEFQTALHHGSGFGSAGLIDRLLLRDHQGIPYLAGSAIKGKLRHAARRLLASGIPVGEKPPCQTPAAPFPCESQPCLICAIFGSPLLPGAVVFPDAYPTRPELDALRLALAPDSPASLTLGGAVGVRSTSALHRGRRTALKHNLFTSETLSPLVRFECELGGKLDRFRPFLTNCCSVLDSFGSGSSRGMGLCKFDLAPMDGPEHV